MLFEPLNERAINELLKLKEDGYLFHRESQELEFKQQFNFGGIAEYLRDFAAFANNRGGYLVFGIKDRPRRELVGLSFTSENQFEKIDPEKISEYIINIFSSDIRWEQCIYELNGKSFGVFYVYEAALKPIIAKKDEGRDQVIKDGDIYYRYGGRTQKIRFAELERIINYRVETNNEHWRSLFEKIAKAGPQNAAILDTEKGVIEKGDKQILVIEESLAQGFQWIKEGSFSEKEGAKTLKLVGEVQPINQVEIIRRERENLLKEYPLTAKDVISRVKEKIPNIKQNQIYDIIKNNDIKSNTKYAYYAFRSVKQMEEYETDGNLPKAITSIYKPNVVDEICDIYRSIY